MASRTTPPWRIRVQYGDQLGQLCGIWPEPPRYHIFALLSSNGLLWAGLGHGLVALDGQAVVLEQPAEFPALATFQGTLWYADLSDQAGLCCRQSEQWLAVPAPFRRCHALCALSSGELAAAADHALWLSADGDRWEQLITSSAPLTNLWEAAPGILWAATAPSTILRYNLAQRTSDTLALPASRAAHWRQEINAALPEGPDQGWVNSLSHGFLSWDGAAWARIPSKPSRRPLAAGLTGHVEHLYAAHDQQWLCSTGGLAYLQDGQWWDITPARQLATGQFMVFGAPGMARLCSSPHGRLLFGGPYGELGWIDLNTPADLREISDRVYEQYRPIQLTTL